MYQQKPQKSGMGMGTAVAAGTQHFALLSMFLFLTNITLAVIGGAGLLGGMLLGEAISDGGDFGGGDDYGGGDGDW
jgi:hypothetical protein